ncbi:hypothetical protein LTR56_011463 [Elasticomyces elasticus]|nr:hypothetical protein LTR56_011463 [Elasticomyces elasticus]KAK3655943.1 hypothetical protein LTR22_009952 [Elasticomyces elasticus]KAK4921442.1 hypothetical protein LTR49_011096 [Elasticomyces elasticus]KAK5760086.1 hypothetical protein LTS12_009817 [Elasticomyces elasticus]
METSTSTQTQAATSCQASILGGIFFRLPPELRLHIYSFILGVPSSRSIEHRRPDTPYAELDSYKVLAPLMRVSSLIREDAMGLYQQHLRDARVVLIGRQMALEEKLRRAYAVDATRSAFGRNRAMTYRQQIKDNRKWMARVEEVWKEVEKTFQEGTE